MATVVLMEYFIHVTFKLVTFGKSNDVIFQMLLPGTLKVGRFNF